MIQCESNSFLVRERKAFCITFLKDGYRLGIDTDKVVSGLTLILKYSSNGKVLMPRWLTRGIELYLDWYGSKSIYSSMAFTTGSLTYFTFAKHFTRHVLRKNQSITV